MSIVEKKGVYMNYNSMKEEEGEEGEKKKPHSL